MTVKTCVYDAVCCVNKGALGKLNNYESITIEI